MVKKNYTSVGTCIWCKRSAPEVTFYNTPHIAPHAVGCDRVGFDVCDDCNKYFGTATSSRPNTNLIFTEIFKTIRLFSNNPDINSWRTYRSSYFMYQHTHNTIKIKKTFDCRVITTQFKRSLYEVFLQHYHEQTGTGLDPKFDEVRQYARYNKGDLQVYYVNSLFVVTSDDINAFWTKGVDDIEEYGYYTMIINGHFFILEITTTKARFMRDSYISMFKKKNEALFLGGKGLVQINDIGNVDFLMKRWRDIKIVTNHKLILQNNLII